MSQLDLAGEAEISQRHLSFVESGRAAPSRDMVIRLAEGLDIPLRQRNRMLLAAGFAPHYSERPVNGPSLAPAMDTVRAVLKGHEPCPAIAVDRHWNMIASNEAIAPFLAGVEDPSLLQPPVNVLRLSLHPKGVAPHIVNLAEWKAHLLERLRRQVDTSGDSTLEELESELRAYPGGVSQTRIVHNEGTAIAHMLRLKAGDAVLSFISTITVFGTPLDVTLSELAIESFFPADEPTRMALQRLSMPQA
ncbi:helix-turn-helix domain-containing protein [Arvimicrobium flavum]|uniref:helix-turn-helix domain-containing protein n=1 Tax=Arvimicrobium flavum TaxID=3393320 RepID=UPI00237AEDCB|nr:helix-turn-helix transcriptional regulator [Mesorhizobium shangrilense]